MFAVKALTEITLRALLVAALLFNTLAINPMSVQAESVSIIARRFGDASRFKPPTFERPTQRRFYLPCVRRKCLRPIFKTVQWVVLQSVFCFLSPCGSTVFNGKPLSNTKACVELVEMTRWSQRKSPRNVGFFSFLCIFCSSW